MAGVIIIFFLLCGWFYFELGRKYLLSKLRLHSLHQRKSNPAAQHVDIIIPDMFQTFLKFPPKVNPHYKGVRLESEEWLSRFDDRLRCPPAVVNVDTASAHMEKG